MRSLMDNTFACQIMPWRWQARLLSYWRYRRRAGISYVSWIRLRSTSLFDIADWSDI